MNRVLTLIAIILPVFLLFSSSQARAGDNAVIPLITNKNATTGTADTMKTVMLDEFDAFGIYISATDTLQADVYIEYTATGTGKYAQYVDSILLINPSGGLKCITLRSAKVENIPLGADQMRVIIARRNYGQASVGKFSFGLQPYPYRRNKSKN